jgi:hypothetical protein
MSKPLCSVIAQNYQSFEGMCQVSQVKNDSCPLHVPACAAEFGAKGFYNFKTPVEHPRWNGYANVQEKIEVLGADNQVEVVRTQS